MMWFPDSNWLKALDMKGTAAAVFVASASLWLFSEGELFYLHTLPAWFKAVFAITAIMSLAILGAKLWDWGRGLWIERRESEQQAAQTSVAIPTLASHG